MNRFLYPDREESAVTTRPSHSAYLYIDSEDRYILNKQITNDIIQQTNPNDILINTQKTLGMGKIKRLALTELYFPWTTPNVIDGINNKFFISDDSDGEIYYTFVEEGFYTPEQLASILTNNLNEFLFRLSDDTPSDFGQPWKVEYINRKPSQQYNIKSDSTSTTDILNITNNPINTPNIVNMINQPLTITTTDIFPTNYLKNYVFSITTGDPDVEFTILSNTSDINTSFSLANIMGLSGLPQYVDLPQGYTAFGGLPTMRYTRYVDICSRTLTKFQNLPDAQTQSNYDSILYRLYIEDPTQPNVIIKEITNPKYILWNENEMITSIDIQLRDDKGNLLPIPSENWDNNYLLTLQMSES